MTEARREAGLTQKALAERLGVSLWTLDALEAGREDIARHAPAIATATGMRAETLASAAIEPDAVVSRPHTPALARARVASARAIRAASGRHLVLSALALLVLVRFFTEVVHVAPRALNFIDIPLFLVLGLAALSRPLDKHSRGQNLPMAAVGLGFVALSAVSIALNISRVAPGPVLVFLYGFLAPLGVYAAVYRLWPAGHAASLSRALVTLGAVQLAVVGLIDLPRFSSSSRRPSPFSRETRATTYRNVSMPPAASSVFTATNRKRSSSVRVQARSRAAPGRPSRSHRAPRRRTFRGPM